MSGHGQWVCVLGQKQKKKSKKQGKKNHIPQDPSSHSNYEPWNETNATQRNAMPHGKKLKS